MGKSVRSSEELEQFAQQHFCYEVWACANGAARWYLGRALLGRHTAAELMVAQLVHLRALDSFLFAPRLKDDVVAGDYVDRWVASDEPPLGDHRQWINQHVAHFSLARTAGREWHPVDLTRAVLEETDRFLRQINDEHPERARWFEPAAAVTGAFGEWASAMRIEWDDPPGGHGSAEWPTPDLGSFEGWPAPSEIGSW